MIGADVRKYEIKLLFRLKAEFQRDDERVIDTGEDETFGKSMSYLVSGHDMGLSDCLEGVDPAGVSFPHLHHFAETTFADYGGQFEVLDGQ